MVEVLGDGYTYNLKAVGHNGRAKSRHFNLLKTVHRSEEVENSTAEGSAETEQQGCSNINVCPDEDNLSDNGEDPTDTYVDHPVDDGNLGQTKWVRRSSGKTKETKILQADGKKKTYSSSKAIDFDDSE